MNANVDANGKIDGKQTEFALKVRDYSSRNFSCTAQLLQV